MNVKITPYDDAKYGFVLRPFVAAMARELHANAHKGDRPGWLTMSGRQALEEIYYHVSKLHYAVRHDDAAGVVEYAADVANMCMMLVDTLGLLKVEETHA